LCVFPQLEKVLQQGDISEVAEPYMKDDKVGYVSECLGKVIINAVVC